MTLVQGDLQYGIVIHCEATNAYAKIIELPGRWFERDRNMRTFFIHVNGPNCGVQHHNYDAMTMDDAKLFANWLISDAPNPCHKHFL